MKRTLYLKFVLAYLIFGFFGFVVVATFTSSMTLEHLKRERADALYQEAMLVSNSYAADLYNSEITLESVWRQIKAIDTFLVFGYQAFDQKWLSCKRPKSEFVFNFFFKFCSCWQAKCYLEITNHSYFLLVKNIYYKILISVFYNNFQT